MIPAEQLALMAPVAAYPGYFISPDGPVYYQTQSGELRPLKIRQTARGRLYVRVHDADGRRHEPGIRKLLIDTFLTAREEDHETEGAVGNSS